MMIRVTKIKIHKCEVGPLRNKITEVNKLDQYDLIRVPNYCMQETE